MPEKVPEQQLTLRANSSTPVFLGMVVICVVLLGDALVRGRWDVALTAVPAAGLVIWTAVVVYARPCLRLTDTGLSVVNILRTTDAPWGQVDDITIRHSVVVALKDGSRIRCWGAPTSARSLPPQTETTGDQNRDAGRGRGRTGSTAHRMIAEIWSRHADEAPGLGEVRRTWHVWSIATGGTLLAVVLSQAAVAALG